MATIKNDYNESKFKKELQSLKENATKVESMVSISLIASQTAKFLLSRNEPEQGDFKLRMKLSELTQHLYKLAGYNKDNGRNGTFENLVTVSIRTAIMQVSKTFDKKQNLSFEENGIFISSKFKSPKIMTGTDRNGKPIWQVNSSTEMVAMNVSDLKALWKDLNKSGNNEENRNKRQVTKKKVQKLQVQVNTKFKELADLLRDNFKETQKGGQAIWDMKLITEHLSQVQIAELKSDMNLIFGFYLNARKAFIAMNSDGSKAEVVALDNIRDDHLKRVINS